MHQAQSDEIGRLEETLAIRYEDQPVEERELHMYETLNEELSQKVQELQVYIEGEFNGTLKDLYHERD